MLAITYLSSATALLPAAALLELLATSRERNEQAGITGVLLYADGNFIQTIEGPDEVGEDAFARIQADPRHGGVLEVWREEIAERAFPDWSMGFRELSAAEVERLPGFSSYLCGRGEQLVQDAGAFTPRPRSSGSSATARVAARRGATADGPDRPDGPGLPDMCGHRSS